MISCIQDRRTSALASAKWLARDWDETSNSLHPTIYDKGLVLASLLEEIDKANLSSASDSTQFYFLQRCLGMDTELDIWYEEFVIRTPSSPYWPTPLVVRSDSPGLLPGPRGQPRLSFANLSIASTTITFWALKIIISSTIATACSAILSSPTRRQGVASFDTVETVSTGPDDVKDKSDPVSSPDEATAKAQRLSKQYDFIQRKDLATLIVRSMPYCLNFNMGLLGPQRAFFALRTALGLLKSNPSPEQKWLRSNHKKLSERYVKPTRSDAAVAQSVPFNDTLSHIPGYWTNTPQYHHIYQLFLATCDELSTRGPLRINRSRLSVGVSAQTRRHHHHHHHHV